MLKQKIEFEIPAYILSAIHKSREDLIRKMRILTAVNLYLSEEISLEMAAEFAEVSKWEFEEFLSKHEIPISLVNFDDYKLELAIWDNLRLSNPISA